MDAKRVVEPTEQELQKNLDKDDGLERINISSARKVRICPASCLPNSRKQAGL